MEWYYQQLILESVRNIIFRMVEIETKNRYLGYCVSNAAAQVAAGLVEIMADEKAKFLKEKVKMPSIHPSKQSHVQELLDSLLRDVATGTNLVIPCERGMQPTKDHIEDAKSPGNLYFDDKNSGKHLEIENDVLIQFINPQIHFEVPGVSGAGSVVLSAIKMQVKFLLVADQNGAVALSKEKQDTIMKFRNIWSLEDCQFFAKKVKEGEEIRWIPLECMIDHNIEVSLFGRVIDHAKVIYQTDTPNPLYYQRNSKKTIGEEPNTLNFNIPVLRCTSTSTEYVIFFDLFKNLLLYRDPESGERSERLKEMLLALEQSSDLQYYKFTVLALQEKLRQTEFLLKYGKRGGVKLLAPEMADVRKSWIEYRNDLFVLMEGLQNLQNLEKKRQSLHIFWQLFVQIDEFIWLLQRDDKSCLCKWSINNLNFVWINNEDQSNINTLEIDSTSIENLSESPNMFREVVSPYNPDGNYINYEKQKMIRVYWREEAPVAGIQVVSHFEVNIHPILIQVTYEFGLLLARYLFPGVNETSEAKYPSNSDVSSVRDSETNKKNESFLSVPIQTAFRNSETKRSLTSINKRDSESRRSLMPSTMSDHESNHLKQMHDRASQNKSFIYIKVPGVQHCLSYRGSKEKNFEDLNRFAFYLPTLEYRNKTWTWLDFLNAIKKGTIICFDI